MLRQVVGGLVVLIRTRLRPPFGRLKTGTELCSGGAGAVVARLENDDA